MGRLAESIEVQRHANGGVHTQAFEGADFAMAADAAGGRDGELRGAAQFAEPGEIGATHGSFVVHIGAEKLRGVAAQFREDFLGAQAKLFLPAVDQDVPTIGVYGDDDVLASDAGGEAREMRDLLFLSGRQRCRR